MRSLLQPINPLLSADADAIVGIPVEPALSGPHGPTQTDTAKSSLARVAVHLDQTMEEFRHLLQSLFIAL